MTTVCGAMVVIEKMLLLLLVVVLVVVVLEPCPMSQQSKIGRNAPAPTTAPIFPKAWPAVYTVRPKQSVTINQMVRSPVP